MLYAQQFVYSLLNALQEGSLELRILDSMEDHFAVVEEFRVRDTGITVIRERLKDKVAKTGGAIRAFIQQQRRASFFDAQEFFRQNIAVVLNLGGHNQGVFGLARPHHADGRVAGVERGKGAIEYVKSKRLFLRLRLDGIVDAQLTGDQGSDGWLAQKIVAVRTGIDQQINIGGPV